MKHQPLVDLRHNHISFGSGAPGAPHIAFGVDAPADDRAAKLQELHNQAAAFHSRYRDIKPGGLIGLFEDTSPKKWESILHDGALDQVKAEIVRENFPGWMTELRQQIKAVKNDSTAYTKTIESLPLDDTITTMIDAGKALRGTHHNQSRAIDVDPVAYRDFRDAGRKLESLRTLLRFDGKGGDPALTPERYVALYAKPAALPALEKSTTNRPGAYEVHYSDDDMALHEQVVEARELIASRYYRLFLAELAVGRWPTLTLNIAPTIDELEHRAGIIADAGSIELVG